MPKTKHMSISAEDLRDMLEGKQPTIYTTDGTPVTVIPGATLSHIEIIRIIHYIELARSNAFNRQLKADAQADAQAQSEGFV